MYFLNDTERKYLLRGLLPKARASPVAEELRGWSWHQPPLQPCYDHLTLAVFEIAGKYCPTGRDLYLRRVQGLTRPATRAMIEGGCLHRALAASVLAAKRLIYRLGVNGAGEIEKGLLELSFAGLAELGYGGSDDAAGELPPDQVADVLARCNTLAHFEATRTVARVEETLTAFPYIGDDALCSIALPLVVEQRLNGSLLGMSGNLSADALTIGQALVVDTKFGRPRDFHRLAITGYALAMESLYEAPVDIGCIAYGDFSKGRIQVRREFHLIDDELRQWFIEERDQKARLINDENDPGRPETCPPYCQYLEECRGEGKPGGRGRKA